MIPNRRTLFDIPKDVVYLNCASQDQFMSLRSCVIGYKISGAGITFVSSQETISASAIKPSAIFSMLVQASR